jgi:hypothetical protein
VRNEVVLERAKEERDVPHKVNRRKVNWIGHFLRKNCLIKRVIGGNI